MLEPARSQSLELNKRTAVSGDKNAIHPGHSQPDIFVIIV